MTNYYVILGYLPKRTLKTKQLNIYGTMKSSFKIKSSYLNKTCLEHHVRVSTTDLAQSMSLF